MDIPVEAAQAATGTAPLSTEERPSLQECLADAKQYKQTRFSEIRATGQMLTRELVEQIEAEKIEHVGKHTSRYNIAMAPGSDLLDLARLYVEANQLEHADAAVAMRLAQAGLSPVERADALSLALDIAMRVPSEEHLPQLEEIVTRLEDLGDGVQVQQLLAHGNLARYYYHKLNREDGYRRHLERVLDIYSQLEPAERELEKLSVPLQFWFHSLDIGEEPTYSTTRALLTRAAELLTDNAKVATALQKELQRFDLVGKTGAPIEARYWLNGKPEGALPRRGRLTLLNFTANWCGFCKAGYPVLKALHEHFQQRGLDIACVTELYGRFGQDQNVSADDEVERDRKYFVEEHGLPVPIAINDKEGSRAPDYGINAYPTFVLLDAQQIVRRVFAGVAPTLEATLTAAIEKMLK